MFRRLGILSLLFGVFVVLAVSGVHATTYYVPSMLDGVTYDTGGLVASYDWYLDHDNVAVDGAGLDDNITIVGSGTSLTAISTGAKWRNFDGTDSYIRVDAPVSGTFSYNGSMGMEIVFMLNETPNASGKNFFLMGLGRGLSDTYCSYALQFYQGNNKLYFDTYNGTSRNSLVSNKVWQTGVVYDVVATYDNTTGMKYLYVNGVLDNSAPWSRDGISTSSTLDFSIGCAQLGTTYFNGSVMSARLYHKYINETNVQDNFYYTRVVLGHVTPPYHPPSLPGGVAYETDHLYASYDMYMNNGVVAVDGAGFNDNGTIVGTNNSLVPIGTGAYWWEGNGADSYITVSHPVSSSFNYSGSVVLDVVFYLNNTSLASGKDYFLIGLGRGLSSSYCSYALQFTHTSGKLYFDTCDGTNRDSLMSYTNWQPNTPYEVIAIYDYSNDMKYLYVNGVLDNEHHSSEHGLYMASTLDFRMGCPQLGTTYIDGGIMSGRVYHGEDFDCTLVEKNWYYTQVALGQVTPPSKSYPSAETNAGRVLRQVYGKDGYPGFMGEYAYNISPVNRGLYNKTLYDAFVPSTPFHQDYGESQANSTYTGSTITGLSPVHWKEYYASATITDDYTAPGRTIMVTTDYDGSAVGVNYTTTYTSSVNVVKEGLNVNGYSGFLDDTVSSGASITTSYNGMVTTLTDDASIQNYLKYGTGGTINYSNWQHHSAGETRSANLYLPLSQPKVKQLLAPDGRTGTVMFASHADSESVNSTTIILYGTNNTSSPDYGTKGLIGRGINTTWAAFPTTYNYELGFDDPDIKALLDQMHDNGSEIVPHRLSANVDTRNDAITKIPYYRDNWSTRNWIDHGQASGSRNSGFMSLGNDPTNSTYYIMDLLPGNLTGQDGSMYCWAYQDTMTGDVGMVADKWIGLPQDLLWQNSNLAMSNGEALWQWKSNGVVSDGLYPYLFTNTTIDNIAEDYNVFVWHGYFAQDNTYSTVDTYYNDDGTINTRFDGLLTHIREKSDESVVWNPTISDWGDYIRKLNKVTITPSGASTYTVTNNNIAAINGYSLYASGNYTPTLDGTPMSTRMNNGDTVFWADLSPGTHTLEVT